jgi:mevalonate kinase
VVISTIDSRNFPAKLLLFGEHVLLLGAPALAVPVPAFGGHWDWSAQMDRHHDRLLQFAGSEALKSLEILDCNQFKSDLEAGLFFDSNIPTGYGLGSSGALCAAIYDRYALEKTAELSTLKSIFARMESFFHGNSSGIDPLTSFIGGPILIQNNTDVQPAESKEWEGGRPTVFLIDSRLPRRTGPLVAWFLEQSRMPEFSGKLQDEYLPAHQETLRAWLSADSDSFWLNLQRISRFQFENFAPMIPSTIHEIWEKSFRSEDYVLKICGAGGGGFVLGFARNREATQNLALQTQIIFPLD